MVSKTHVKSCFIWLPGAIFELRLPKYPFAVSEGGAESMYIYAVLALWGAESMHIYVVLASWGAESIHIYTVLAF